jgi:hypothetical protein
MKRILSLVLITTLLISSVQAYADKLLDSPCFEPNEQFTVKWFEENNYYKHPQTNCFINPDFPITFCIKSENGTASCSSAPDYSGQVCNNATIHRKMVEDLNYTKTSVIQCQKSLESSGIKEEALVNQIKNLKIEYDKTKKLYSITLMDAEQCHELVAASSKKIAKLYNIMREHGQIPLDTETLLGACNTALAVSRQETAQCEAEKKETKSILSYGVEFVILTATGTIVTYGIFRLTGLQMAAPAAFVASPITFRYAFYIGLLIGGLNVGANIVKIWI